MLFALHLSRGVSWRWRQTLVESRRHTTGSKTDSRNRKQALLILIFVFLLQVRGVACAVELFGIRQLVRQPVHLPSWFTWLPAMFPRSFVELGSMDALQGGTETPSAASRIHDKRKYVTERSRLTRHAHVSTANDKNKRLCRSRFAFQQVTVTS